MPSDSTSPRMTPTSSVANVQPQVPNEVPLPADDLVQNTVQTQDHPQAVSAPTGAAATAHPQVNSTTIGQHRDDPFQALPSPWAEQETDGISALVPPAREDPTTFLAREGRSRSVLGDMVPVAHSEFQGAPPYYQERRVLGSSARDHQTDPRGFYPNHYPHWNERECYYGPHTRSFVGRSQEGLVYVDYGPLRPAIYARQEGVREHVSGSREPVPRPPQNGTYDLGIGPFVRPERVIQEIGSSIGSGRTLGAKSGRIEDEVRSVQEQAHIDILVEQRAQEIARSRTPVPKTVSEVALEYQNKMANKWEASDGQWKSLQIQDVWPAQWPTYSWIKAWGIGCTIFVKSLRLLHALQVRHGFDLPKAILSFKEKLNSSKRSITPREWELLELSGRVFDAELHQSCWEICLKSNLAVDPNFPDHARVCRTFPPTQVGSLAEWMDAINGGVIPEDCTGGARVRGELTRKGWVRGN